MFKIKESRNFDRKIADFFNYCCNFKISLRKFDSDKEKLK